MAVMPCGNPNPNPTLALARARTQECGGGAAGVLWLLPCDSKGAVVLEVVCWVALEPRHPTPGVLVARRCGAWSGQRRAGGAL